MAGTRSGDPGALGLGVSPAVGPPLTIRIGVAGAHSIAAAADVSALIDGILQFTSEQIGALAEDDRVKAVYETDAAHNVPVNLRFVCSLGEGADRLVAQKALDGKHQLVAPLPFDRLEYENDFPDSKDAFRQFAAAAHVLELDGSRGENEIASYDAAGRTVVRNSDLIIAIWDGTPAHGRDRTADIIRYAVHSGLPVWWINPEGGAPKLIFTARQWRRRDLALDGANARAAMIQYLADTIVPLDSSRPVEFGILRYLVHWPFSKSHDNTPSLRTYLEGKHGVASWRIWRIDSLLLRWIAPKPSGELAQMAPPVGALEHWWENNFRRADSLSVLYGHAYRSSYLMVIGLSLVAFFASAIGAYANGPMAPVYELYLLFFIVSIVAINRKMGWQERWITYRLLAELCRKQFMLSPLGRTLPGVQVNRAAEEVAKNHEVAVPPSEAWVGWYFLALTRGAPALEGGAAASKERALLLGRSLIAQQSDYHRIRQNRSKVAADRLAFAVKLFFGAIVAMLVLRLVPLACEYLFGPALWQKEMKKIPWVEIGSVFSALTAACVGLRSYAEFALVARQSLHMQQIMTEFAAELNGIDLNLPLATQDLGSGLHRLAILMMQEVGGWAQLFRLKSVEAA